MAVTPADLLAPAGPVEVTLFPGEDVASEVNPGSTKLEDRLQTYIDRAVARTEGIAFPRPDDAVAMYALYLTFMAAYVLAASRPATENAQVEIIGSYGYSKDQRDALKAQANQYLTEYETLYAMVPISTQPATARSRQITNEFEW